MASVAETVQIALRVPVETRDELERIAERDDRNLSYIVRQAIRAYLEAQHQDAA